MHVLEPRAEFDQFIVGVARWKPHFPASVVYDEDEIISHLIAKAQEANPTLSDEDAYWEAVDHFEYNIIGGSGFYGAPVFVSRDHWEVILIQEQEDADQVNQTKEDPMPKVHEEE